jgi:hypothetical protein
MTSSWKRRARRKLRRAKDGPYLVVALVLIAMCIVLLIAYIAPYFQAITYLYDYRTYDYDDDDDTNYYYYEDIIYTDGIYVHKDGDSSTGESWETAYSTITAAITAASADLDDKTIIFVGLGTFDVNVATQLNIIKNVHIVGSGREGTIFRNSHANADYVFNVTQNFKMEECEIFFNQSCGGINIHNTSKINLENINFNTEVNHTGNPEALRINGAFHGEYKDIHFDGINTASTAINISGASHNEFTNIMIFEYNFTAIQICNNSEDNIFENIHILSSLVGINIDSGIGQHFHTVGINNCTVNVDDEVGNSYWHGITAETMLVAVVPDDLTGVDVNGGVGANVYGADVLVSDASASDRPYYVIAILFEPDVGERYGLRIWDTFAATYIYETVMEAKFADQIDRHTIEFPRIFNAHNQLYISIKSESGGDDMDIWLEIIAI